jgi:hypothetical protein
MHKRWVALMAGVCLALPVPAALSARPSIRLAPGEAYFWTGPQVESSSDSWTYRFEITDGAYRLRVGIDHPEVDDDFTARLSIPGGGARTFSAGGGLYSAETIIDSPPLGDYELTVSANSVTETNHRVRVKLEATEPSLGVKDGPVLPNLQVLPPHEASFLFPVSNGGLGDPPQGLDNGGVESCHPEEHAEDQAIRCLRFAFGVRNTGRGAMDMYYEGAGVGADKPLFQVVHFVGGATKLRPAGTAKYHKTHSHYHHDAAIGLRLFKVTDPKRGTLEAAGAMRTKGFAHRMELLREWDVFYPTMPLQGFGLGPGWADIYEWDRPGNYIDFGLNTDGRYLIRMWADPVDGVLESNERDNVAYTYLRIEGDDVQILEAGRGSDPWDRCKIVVGLGGHPDPRGQDRPESCPPDTV